MLAVLGTVASDHFIFSIVSIEWERDFQDMATWLDDVEQTFDLLTLLFGAHSRCLPVLNQFLLQDFARFVVKVLHHVEKERIFSILNTL